LKSVAAHRFWTYLPFPLPPSCRATHRPLTRSKAHVTWAASTRCPIMMMFPERFSFFHPGGEFCFFSPPIPLLSWASSDDTRRCEPEGKATFPKPCFPLFGRMLGGSPCRSIRLRGLPRGSEETVFLAVTSFRRAPTFSRFGGWTRGATDLVAYPRLTMQTGHSALSLKRFFFPFFSLPPPPNPFFFPGLR